MQTLTPSPATTTIDNIEWIQEDRLPVDGAPLFQIPDADTARFARLPDAVRKDVLFRLNMLQWIHRQPKLRQACKAAANMFHGEQGRSAVTWRRFRDDYMAGRDWTVLVDKAKAGAEWWQTQRVKLPDAFVEFWKGVCERNQRKCEPARRYAIRRWKQWLKGDQSAAIPGYDKCPAADPNTGIPRGWTRTNLHRHIPSTFELTAARIGRSAAAAHRPLVLTSRVGLEVGQYYLFDDMWHDFKVNVVGQRRAQRLLQFHALDLFSACQFARGMKPILENLETGKQERLKEVEMVFLLSHVLSTTGYRGEGTTLVVEHGTAAIREDVEKRLYDLTGGKITIDRGGIEKHASFAGLFEGAPKGNYRFKAALESSHNLIHNETANMLEIPGQSGRNRDESPEELYGRDQLNNRLLKALEALPAERAAMLRLPFLELNEARFLLEDIQERINQRVEHELEGWIEAGLVAKEFRIDPSMPWLSMERYLEFPPDKQKAVQAFMEPRVRKLSPREVFDSGRAGLKRMPGHMIAILLGPELGMEVSVRKGRIEFQNQELSPSPLLYQAHQYADGEKFVAVVNHCDIERLYLFNAKGGFVGEAKREHRICRADTDALHRACGRAAKIEKELLAPVAARGAVITRQRKEDALHNAGVLSGNIKTESEKQREAQVKERIKDLDRDDYEAFSSLQLTNEEQSPIEQDASSIEELL